MCNCFFVAKCIGHYVLDFVLANVLLAGWAGCWLLAAFAFHAKLHENDQNVQRLCMQPSSKKSMKIIKSLVTQQGSK